MAPDDEKAQRRLEHFKGKLSATLELQRATAAFEHAALKPLYLLNGGAIAVMLTLYGSLAARTTGFPPGIGPDWIVAGIVAWALGLFMAAATSVAGFLSQLDFQRDGTQSIQAILASDRGEPEARGRHQGNAECFAARGGRRRNLALVFGAGSLAAFLIGVALCLVGFIAWSQQCSELPRSSLGSD